jgi:4-amino-4-deoxy-L-arabinose transferase-like glycosyltransferase
MVNQMKKVLLNWWNEEIVKHRLVYALLLLILLGSLFIRVYRVGELLQFYYDQGRDALVIWDLWHKGKPFLIGPITGLTGIFLGPFYYYLIAPFYLIGGGNPMYPAIFLSFLSVCALLVIYYLGWQMQSRVTGLIAATIGGFSYYMMIAGRWLSNPTPILFTSTLLLLCLWKIIIGKDKRSVKNYWPFVALILGFSMQFESASAIFYIPMVSVFALWQIVEDKKANAKNPNAKWLTKKEFSIYLFSILVFLFTLFPQIIFNYRHENLLFDNFSKLFFHDQGFKLSIGEVLPIRLAYFWSVFSSKINPTYIWANVLFTLIALGSLFFNRNQLKTQKVIILFLIFLGIPMIGYILFQGNYGNMYDYYMTGYYMPMILLFSLGLGLLWNSWLGKLTILFFFMTFFQVTIPLTKNYITAKVDGPNDVRLLTERQGVNWIFYDGQSYCKREQGPPFAKGFGVAQQIDNNDTSCEYNVDVYVPPVIPHSYEYLFQWLGSIDCGPDMCGKVDNKQTEIIYLLYEEDPPHPERLQVWLDRYKYTTVVENHMRFGGVNVERRVRLQVQN